MHPMLLKVQHLFMSLVVVIHVVKIKGIHRRERVVWREA